MMMCFLLHIAPASCLSHASLCNKSSTPWWFSQPAQDDTLNARTDSPPISRASRCSIARPPRHGTSRSSGYIWLCLLHDSTTSSDLCSEKQKESRSNPEKVKASLGHAVVQRMHPVQARASKLILRSLSDIAPAVHTSLQFAHSQRFRRFRRHLSWTKSAICWVECEASF